MRSDMPGILKLFVRTGWMGGRWVRSSWSNVCWIDLLGGEFRWQTKLVRENWLEVQEDKVEHYFSGWGFHLLLPGVFAQMDPEEQGTWAAVSCFGGAALVGEGFGLPGRRLMGFPFGLLSLDFFHLVLRWPEA